MEVDSDAWKTEPAFRCRGWSRDSTKVTEALDEHALRTSLLILADRVWAAEGCVPRYRKATSDIHGLEFAHERLARQGPIEAVDKRIGKRQPQSMACPR